MQLGASPSDLVSCSKFAQKLPPNSQESTVPYRLNSTEKSCDFVLKNVSFIFGEEGKGMGFFFKERKKIKIA